jgi:hypothetical protein
MPLTAESDSAEMPTQGTFREGTPPMTRRPARRPTRRRIASVTTSTLAAPLSIVALAGYALFLTMASDAAEVGTNDFRISDIGPNNTVGFEAFESKIAYNSATEIWLSGAATSR